MHYLFLLCDYELINLILNYTNIILKWEILLKEFSAMS